MNSKRARGMRRAREANNLGLGANLGMAGGPAFDPAEAAKSLQSFAMSFRTESETR